MNPFNNSPRAAITTASDTGSISAAANFNREPSEKPAMLHAASAAFLNAYEANTACQISGVFETNGCLSGAGYED